MRAAEIVFLALLGAFMAGFCLLGQFYYVYSPGLMLFPALIAGVALLLIAVQVVVVLRAAVPEEGSGSRSGFDVPRLLWLSSVLVFVVLAGYPVGLALYLLCVLRQAGESWAVALGHAAGSLPVSFGLFVVLLGVPLPLLPFWWPT